MKHRECVFDEDFRRKCVWPKRKTLRDWVVTSNLIRRNVGAARLKRIGGGVYSAILAGSPCTTTYLATMIAYLRHESHAVDPEGKAFRAILSQRGINDFERLTDDQLLLTLIAPQTDYLVRGTDVLSDLAEQSTRSFLKIRPALPLELPHLCDRLFVEGGRAIANEALSEGAAREVSAKLLNMTLDTYIEHKAKAHLINPWVFAVWGGLGRVQSMSVAIPLTDEAYDNVLNGTLSPLSLEPKHIVNASSRIYVEMVAMTPHPGIAKRSVPALNLACLAVCHHAHLSDVPGIERKIPLRLLSGAGTGEFENVLQSFGYKRQPACVANTSLKLYEQSVKWSTSSLRLTPYLGVLDGLRLILRTRGRKAA